MKAYARLSAAAPTILLALFVAQPGLAVPLHGETVRAGRERTTLTGTVERVLGSSAVEIRAGDGSLVRVLFLSRFAHVTVREGRPLSAGMLHKGQPVSVTGIRRGRTFRADRMEVK